MSRSVDCFNICLIASLHYPACSAADLAALQCNCAHCVSSAYYTIQKPIIMPDFARLMQSVFNITTVCYHKSRNSISLYFLLFYMWKKPTKQNTRCDKYTIWINVTGKSGNLSVRIFQQNIVFKYYQSKNILQYSQYFCFTAQDILLLYSLLPPSLRLLQIRDWIVLQLYTLSSDRCFTFHKKLTM